MIRLVRLIALLSCSTLFREQTNTWQPREVWRQMGFYPCGLPAGMRDGQILPQGKLFRDIGYRERPVEVTSHGKVERPAAMVENAVTAAIVWAGVHDVLKG